MQKFVTNIVFLVFLSPVLSAQTGSEIAKIHFLRTDRFYGKWVKVNVLVNDSIIGKLKNGQRLIYELEPRDSIMVSGLYKLTNKESDETIRFKPEGGKEYFFELFFYGDMYKPSAIIWTGTTAIQFAEPVEYGIRIVGLEPTAGRIKFEAEGLYKSKNETIMVR